MGRIINTLFEAQENGKDFQKLDREILQECERQLRVFKEHMQTEEYEQIRDAVFTASCMAKRAAFETGFKTAADLILECRESDRLL